MSEGWHTITLGNHCLKIGSGATPRGGLQIYLTEGKYSLVRSQNVYNDGFKEAGLVYITEEEAKKLDNVTLRSQDILLNITGDSVARCCLMDDDYLPGRVNQHVSIIRPNTSELENRFLRYVLISPSWQDKLLTMAASGATRNALTKVMIENLEMIVPEGINEQRAIAYVLGTLDDKIELNRRMNETLEGIARALFRSWFIDFDPVRAKAEGRQPFGMDEETAALFPSEFEGSELGEIPKGWATISIQGYCTMVTDGAHFSPKEDSEGIRLMASVKDMGVFDFNVKSCKRISEDEYQKLAISNCKPAPGDVLLSKDGTMGKVQLFYGHQDLVLLSSIALLRTGSVKKAQFLYCYLRWFVDSGKLDQFSSGSVLRRLVVKDIARIPLINPGEKVINAFSKYVSNIFDLIFSNVVQISTLTDIRDRLLPKLISGDIRVDPSKFGFGPEEEKVEEV